MKNQKNNQVRTPEEIAKDMRKLRAEQAKLEKEMLSAMQNPAEESTVVVGNSGKESEVTEEVTETSTEEVKATEEVTEISTEEVEATEEVTEISTEEAEATEEVTETSTEEAEATEEVTQTSNSTFIADVLFPDGIPEAVSEDGEEDFISQVIQTPAEEVETTEEVTETSDENAEDSEKPKKSTILTIVGGVVIGCILVLLITLILSAAKKDNQNHDNNEDSGNSGGADTEWSESDNQLNGSEEKFDIVEFKNSVVAIAKQYTDDEDVSANVDILVENIGEDKLKELIGKYDELKVQTAIAEYMVFVPEIKMQQYIAKNALDYNPNAADDYNQKLLEANEAYTAATNKDPDGALMSLEGYVTHKSNRDAMKALIVQSGDTALLDWYIIKTEGYDLMHKQIQDTQTAEEYKEEVKLEIVNSEGSAKLLELQLEEEANGKITVMDNVSMQYTESYNQFILNNYMYVVAN